MRGRGRYGNVKKPMFRGRRFDSQRELNRYLELRMLRAAGVIRDLELQPSYPIEIAGIKIMLKSKRYHIHGRQMVYIADFRYFDIEMEDVVIEDVKMQSGHRDRVYCIKRALMEAMGYRIHEV